MSLDIFFIVLASIIGFTMAWGVGANDLANIMSTTLGSKSVPISIAIVIAIIFEFAGAFFGGTHVTNTIRSGFIDLSKIHSQNLMIYGMLAVLLASSTWMLVASYLGLPVSIINATVGSVIGFGATIFGLHAIHWSMVGYTAISWVSSPTIAGIMAYLFFMIISRTVLGRSQPLKAAQRFIPLFLIIVSLVLSVIVVHKGLIHFGVHLSPLVNMGAMALSTAVFSLIGFPIIKKIKCETTCSRHEQFACIEKKFAILMAMTACAMVFAHGSNDVAVSVGPIVAIIAAVQHTQGGSSSIPIPAWVMFLGCTGVVTGLIMYGRKVIETIGSGITALTPSRAVAATLAAACTVLVSTSTGIPVSTTQTLVGAVLGVGLARGIGALNLNVIRNIFLSWIITIPVAASLTILYYYIFKAIFN